MTLEIPNNQEGGTDASKFIHMVEVAEAAEENIRETCNELDIEVIDMAVNIDH